ncbi:MAG: DEAD/DEAH box helicase, partial [Thermoplasmatota archaeon]
MAYTTGTPAGIDPEDFRRAKLILLWGTNTLTSGHHLWKFVQAARNADLVHLALPTPAFACLGDIVQHAAPVPVVVAFEGHLVGSSAIASADARRPSALVLAPTRELVSQIVEEARPLAAARGLKVAAVYGGVGFEKQTREARAAHLLVATPGRLLDHLRQGAAKLDGLQILVLDEADRMLDMGFLPDVERIIKLTPPQRQTALFSATVPEPIRRLSQRFLRNPTEVRT